VGQGTLVEVEVGCVVRTPGRPGACGADECERAGDTQQELAEVFAAHGPDVRRDASRRRDRSERLSRAQRALGLGRVVHDRGADPPVRHLRGAPEGLCRAFRDFADEGRQAVGDFNVERSARAAERHGLRQDVERRAPVHRGHGDDRRKQRREPPRDDRLERRDDVGGGHDRVARFVGGGGVAARTRHLDEELVHGGHHRAARDADVAERQGRPQVHAEDHVGAGVVEDAVRDHGLRAARAFLSRLEREDDAAPGGRIEKQKVRCGIQRRHVSVVPARVHLSVCRGERQSRSLHERQRVEIRAQEDGLAGSPGVEKGGDAGLSDTCPHLEAARDHPRRDEASRLDLLERGLRQGVDLSPQSDGPGVDALLAGRERFHVGIIGPGRAILDT
jgi:hypothetical protein